MSLIFDTKASIFFLRFKKVKKIINFSLLFCFNTVLYTCHSHREAKLLKLQYVYVNNNQSKRLNNKIKKFHMNVTIILLNSHI